MANVRLGSYETDAVMRLGKPIRLNRYYKLREAGIVQHDALDVTRDMSIHLGAYLWGHKKKIAHRALMEMNGRLTRGTLFDAVYYASTFGISPEQACQVANARLPRHGKSSYKNLLTEGCVHEKIIAAATAAHELELADWLFETFIAYVLLTGPARDEAEFCRLDNTVLLPYVTAYKAGVAHETIMGAIREGLDFGDISSRILQLVPSTD